MLKLRARNGRNYQDLCLLLSRSDGNPKMPHGRKSIGSVICQTISSFGIGQIIRSSRNENAGTKKASPQAQKWVWSNFVLGEVRKPVKAIWQ
ncbi:predicted protein [Sclerotinia sclerotiorum 1980 UF-70]|uniref:Uncharacterized protein n=1 Tax=Sclerotinia sclerotiorum (strain ATCC 18683 / 1980 / Ss-1) TaxID=665079 RepID=A7EMX0_SCLS1|nr:predicted protein [Sclerotinia sclerotiorum 1980 UF-70]EDO04186.1 predicted protein [Sclerotinia sclerotiorum 1980 UF-70]